MDGQQRRRVPRGPALATLSPRRRSRARARPSRAGRTVLAEEEKEEEDENDDDAAGDDDDDEKEDDSEHARVRARVSKRPSQGPSRLGET